MYSDGRSKAISYQYIEERTFIATDIWHGLHVIYSGGAMPYSLKKVAILGAQLEVFEGRVPINEKGHIKTF